MLPLHRDQSVDLQNKSTDWFPYNGNIGRKRVKENRAMYFLKSIQESKMCPYDSVIWNAEKEILTCFQRLIYGYFFFFYEIMES